MNNKTATIEDAVAIAAQVHKGQFDKAGAPYILHPLRLMMQMQTETEMMVAVLHDVVEDSRNSGENQWTFEKLREYGFAEDVLSALDCVTNRIDEAYEDFIDRASNNPIARRVKIADLEDNMNIRRINDLKPRDLERLAKYHRSWTYLIQLNNRSTENKFMNDTETNQNNINEPKISKRDRAITLKNATPEQRAEMDERMERTSRAVLQGLAEHNLEIFGTPIPPELQD